MYHKLQASRMSTGIKRGTIMSSLLSSKYYYVQSICPRNLTARQKRIKKTRATTCSRQTPYTYLTVCLNVHRVYMPHIFRYEKKNLVTTNNVSSDWMRPPEHLTFKNIVELTTHFSTALFFVSHSFNKFCPPGIWHIFRRWHLVNGGQEYAEKFLGTSSMWRVAQSLNPRY